MTDEDKRHKKPELAYHDLLRIQQIFEICEQSLPSVIDEKMEATKLRVGALIAYSQFSHRWRKAERIISRIEKDEERTVTNEQS